MRKVEVVGRCHTPRKIYVLSNVWPSLKGDAQGGRSAKHRQIWDVSLDDYKKLSNTGWTAIWDDFAKKLEKEEGLKGITGQLNYTLL